MALPFRKVEQRHSIDCRVPLTEMLTRFSLMEFFQPFLIHFISWHRKISTTFCCKHLSNFRRAPVHVQLFIQRTQSTFNSFLMFFFRWCKQCSTCVNFYFGSRKNIKKFLKFRNWQNKLNTL